MLTRRSSPPPPHTPPGRCASPLSQIWPKTDHIAYRIEGCNLSTIQFPRLPGRFRSGIGQQRGIGIHESIHWRALFLFLTIGTIGPIGHYFRNSWYYTGRIQTISTTYRPKPTTYRPSGGTSSAAIRLVRPVVGSQCRHLEPVRASASQWATTSPPRLGIQLDYIYSNHF